MGVALSEGRHTFWLILRRWIGAQRSLSTRNTNGSLGNHLPDPEASHSRACRDGLRQLRRILGTLRT
jgi:hypothetical protein